jgi:hypothetical protein
MAKDGNTRLTGTATYVREEDLEALQDLQGDLQDRLDKASDDGRAYMMAQYVRLLAIIKSEAKRIRARFDREILASYRKVESDMRARERAEREAEKERAEANS